MALPLLSYSASTQNARIEGYEVSGDDQSVIFSTQNILSGTDMDALIEAAYRQIFFHAFKSDREPFLESQLRNGQITVREFIRSLFLSDTYRRAFYGMNSNYKCVEQTIQRALGRTPYSNGEKLAWSIVVGSKGLETFIDEVLNSDEYLTNFGDDTVPYQRRRVLPGRATGETPFNVQSPRYDEYYRSVLGFPQVIWTSQANSYKPQVRKQSTLFNEEGNPALFMDMARSLKNKTGPAARVSTSNLSIDKDVPYREINFEIAGPAVVAANSQ